MDWIQGMRDAIQYIEANIEEDLKIDDIAQRAYISSFYFQKAFSMLCGYTVGEYIRRRRLSLAGSEILSTDAKIIDVAVKYGYISPDSFAKAFTRFHGITPSNVRKDGAVIKSFAPLKIKFSLEGGSVMDYRIEEKSEFTIMGVTKMFNSETSYSEIPMFWKEHMQSENGKVICGQYGVCIDTGEKNGNFEYVIADNYNPQKEVPKGFVTRTVPKHTWAVFPCHGAMPKALQDVNTKIYSEWIPNCKDYKVAGNYNIEMYTEGDSSKDDYYTEIWIPVEKADNHR